MSWIVFAGDQSFSFICSVLVVVTRRAKQGRGQVGKERCTNWTTGQPNLGALTLLLKAQALGG